MSRERRDLSIPNKELRKLAIKLERQGWTIESTRNGHLKWTKGEHVVFTSSTPSDYRAMRTIRSEFRRRGVVDV